MCVDFHEIYSLLTCKTNGPNDKINGVIAENAIHVNLAIFFIIPSLINLIKRII